MEFSIVKKGYAPKEVDAYIAAVKREYENTVVKQRDRIAELLAQKEENEKELATHREKSSQIGKAIVSAVAKAEEIERLSRLKYNQEIERLKAFHDKWTQYYDRILDAYPLDDRLAAAGEFNRRMEKILSRVDDENAATAREVAQETPVSSAPPQRQASVSSAQRKASAAPFAPMEKIGRYFDAQKAQQSDVQQTSAQTREPPVAAAKAQKQYTDRSPSGFSFEEALNPTEDLESILKDLGL